MLVLENRMVFAFLYNNEFLFERGLFIYLNFMFWCNLLMHGLREESFKGKLHMQGSIYFQ